MENISIHKLRMHPDNPREIKREKLDALVKSLNDFPEMLNARPIVVDEDYVVLGGNMRLAALKILGYRRVPVVRATGWSEKQKREFVILDNTHAGAWDYDILANRWSDVNELPEFSPVWDVELPPDEYRVVFTTPNKSDARLVMSVVNYAIQNEQIDGEVH